MAEGNIPTLDDIIEQLKIDDPAAKIVDNPEEENLVFVRLLEK